MTPTKASSGLSTRSAGSGIDKMDGVAAGNEAHPAIAPINGADTPVQNAPRGGRVEFTFTYSVTMQL